MWRFIVTSDGKAELFLSVIEENGKYETVAFGGDATHFLDALSKLQNSDHLNDVILMVDGKDNYLLYTDSSGKEITMPIPHPTEASIFQEVSSEIVAEGIKERVKNYTKGERGGISTTNTSPNHPNQSFTWILVAIISIAAPSCGQGVLVTADEFYSNRIN